MVNLKPSSTAALTLNLKHINFMSDFTAISAIIIVTMVDHRIPTIIIEGTTQTHKKSKSLPQMYTPSL